LTADNVNVNVNVNLCSA